MFFLPEQFYDPRKLPGYAVVDLTGLPICTYRRPATTPPEPFARIMAHLRAECRIAGLKASSAAYKR